MKFLLIMIQDGGCDYTIRCGLDIQEIEANNRVDALEKAFQIMAYDWNDSPQIDEEIDRASLYEICGEKTVIPLADYRLNLRQKEIDKQITQEEDREYQEFMRLKEKYE